MIAVQLVCVFYFIHNVWSLSAHRPSVGITGGHTKPISDAPFIASLVRHVEKLPNGKAKLITCGGSIIHERFILTAAHCVEGESHHDVIRVGSSQLHSGGKTYKVEKIIAHSNFSLKDLSFTYDIALVKLKKNIKFDLNVSKIVLADEHFQIKPFSKVNITGWGKKGVQGGVSHEVRQVSLEIRPVDDCMIYPWVTQDQICVRSFHKGSCKGNSGGPMTIGNVQVGVVSNGLACGLKPTVFTKVSFLLPWVQENINKNLQ